MDTALEELKEYESREEKMKRELEEARAKFEKVQEKYDAAVAESNEWNAEYNQIEEEIRELNGVIHKIELGRIKRGNRAERLQGGVEREFLFLRGGGELVLWNLSREFSFFCRLPIGD